MSSCNFGTQKIEQPMGSLKGFVGKEVYIKGVASAGGHVWRKEFPAPTAQDRGPSEASIDIKDLLAPQEFGPNQGQGSGNKDWPTMILGKSIYVVGILQVEPTPTQVMHGPGQFVDVPPGAKYVLIHAKYSLDPIPFPQNK